MSRHVHFVLADHRLSVPASVVGAIIHTRHVGWRDSGAVSRRRLQLVNVAGEPIVIDDARVWLDTAASSARPPWALLWRARAGVLRVGIGVCDVLGVSDSPTSHDCTPAQTRGVNAWLLQAKE